MILVDTSVWVDHLRRNDRGLAAVLDAGQVLMHPFVLGELACGDLPDRPALLKLLSGLPSSPVTTDAEALLYIEEHELMGRGIGYIDVHLLASVALHGKARFWTRHRRLAAVASELSLSLIIAD